MRVAIIGRSEMLYDSAERLLAEGYEIGLIVTAKEAPEYTKTEEDFRKLAAKIGAPFLKTARIAEHIDAMRELPPMEIGVSVNYPGIIPQSVIDCFPLGILNAHGGDLPRYRGNACQAWAIINGEERIGLCIHKMVGGELDSGDIIARDYLPIDVNTKVTAVLDWMRRRIPSLFVEALKALEQDPDYILEEQSKDPKDALRCYPRRPEDGRIDWRMSALDILRLINASNKPYAGAFCEYEGEKLIIWDAELPRDEERFLAVPGQVTSRGEGYIDVATGDGKLRITDVEYRSERVSPERVIDSLRKRLT